jgi:hypothetical protein
VSNFVTDWKINKPNLASSKYQLLHKLRSGKSMYLPKINITSKTRYINNIKNSNILFSQKKTVNVLTKLLSTMYKVNIHNKTTFFFQKTNPVNFYNKYSSFIFLPKLLTGENKTLPSSFLKNLSTVKIPRILRGFKIHQPGFF